MLIASHGGRVIGVDISPELRELAAKRMALHGFDGHEFKVGSPHDLSLDDESVDVVFGMAILHHLDLSLASKEVFRVLRKGGRAIFSEPVRNSATFRFVRGLIPYQSADVSPIERPLTEAELAEFAAPFDGYESRAFSLPFVNLLEVPGLSGKLLSYAVRVDGRILRAFPRLKQYAAIRVFEARKDR